MQDDLFRTEALRYQAVSSTQLGMPTGVMPPSWSLLTLFLSAFMISVFIFLATADMARKETVRGTLRTDGPEAKIYPAEAGLINAVLVENGETVKVGTPLFEISNDRYLRDGVELNAANLEELSQERGSLLEKRTAVKNAATLAREASKLEFEVAERKEVETLEQLEILKYRLETAVKRRDDIFEIQQKGLIAEPVFNERVEAVSVLRQNLLQANAQFADAKSDQLRIQTELKKIGIDLSRDLSDLDQRLSQIDAQITRIKAQKGYVIVAPSSGRLTALNARVGEYATQSTPLAVILPTESQLIAEVYVPSKAIGFVAEGQTVKLQYDPFPYQKFGMAYGTVSSVSNISQRPEELGLSSRTGDPLYEAKIVLAEQTIRAFNKDISLQSGMELTADIVLEDRKLIEWLMEPLLSVR